DLVQPIRSAITVAGMSGNSLSRARTCASTTSTMEPFGARTYFGGCTDRTALRTVLRDNPSLRATALIGICSARYKRRISAQSSTVITLHVLAARSAMEGVSFHPSTRGHFSRVVDTPNLWR